MCGGTCLPAPPYRPGNGLSPRVRGNLDALSDPCVSEGSIPACAGEPSPAGRNWRPLWVYPRVCGGTLCGQLACVIAHGLSPRVRGEPLADAPPEKCAGVYPRVCGGTGDR